LDAEFVRNAVLMRDCAMSIGRAELERFRPVKRDFGNHSIPGAIAEHAIHAANVEANRRECKRGKRSSSHPAHPDFAKIAIGKPAGFAFDPRLLA
jgi:hypothetical protein